MFKWHVNAAIGRGRPVAADVSRVADGIAASLRQFSISLSRHDDGAPKPRSQRAGDTFKEVSSLGPSPSRGVDARSLAAKAPPSSGGFTIRRVDMGTSDGGGGRNFQSPNYRGGGDRGPRPPRSDFRGGAAGGPRGAFRGGARGGMRGRGGGRGRGAGRGRGRGGAKNERDKKEPNADEYVEPEFDQLEMNYVHEAESQYLKPYVPTTTLESLRGYGAAASISNPRGIKENIIHRVESAVGGGFLASEYIHGRDHVLNIAQRGFTIFENKEQRDITQKWQFEEGEDAAQHVRNMSTLPAGEMAKLSKQQKEELLNAWVAGQHQAPKEEKKGDVLSTVGMMTSRNETYLPADAERFERKLRDLLPQRMLSQEPKPVRSPSAAKLQAPL